MVATQVEACSMASTRKPSPNITYLDFFENATFLSALGFASARRWRFGQKKRSFSETLSRVIVVEIPFSCCSGASKNRALQKR